MIKSSNSKFDNTYRILRVLSNKDCLAIDQHQNRFIFSQLHGTGAKSELRSDDSLISQNKSPSQQIIHHKEVLSLDGSTYWVFEIGKNSMLYCEDMEKKRCEHSRFLNSFINEAIVKILGELLWMNHKQSSRVINIRNCWFINDRISLLKMPRCHRQQLKRTQRKRCSSQQGSIGNIINKEMNLISQFGKLLWEILQPSVTVIENQTITQINVKNLLTKMINKKISFEQILIELKGFQYRLTPSKICRSICLKSLQKTVRLSRRHTLQPSMLGINSIEKSKGQLKTPLKLKHKSITEVFNWNKKNEASQINHSEKNKFSNIVASKFKKRWYLNFNSKSKSVSELDGAQVRDKLGSRFATIDTNHSEKKKYLQCIGEKNKLILNFTQKISNRSDQVQNEFKSNLLKSEKQATFPNANQLKERIFSKALKLKFQKPKANSETQPCQNPPQHKNCDINQKNNEKNDIFLMKNNSSKEEKGEKQTKPLSSAFNIQKTQPFSSENVQQLTFYDFRGKFSQKISNKAEESKEFTSEERIKSLKRQNNFVYSNIPKQKMKRMKMNSSQLLQKLDEEQIETITLQKKQTKGINNLQQGSTDEPKPAVINQETPKVQIKHSKFQVLGQCLEKATKAARLKQASIAVREFITLVNILGDICVHCVQNKDKLMEFEWRKSVYFLYERFQYQRRKLLSNLSSNSKEIVRRNQQIDPQSLQLWHQSKQKQQFVQQITRQNEKISTTYRQFSKKTIEECSLQPMIHNFIKNRELILEKKLKNNRLFISKYAVALIINEYDLSIEKKVESKQVLDYIWRSLFGLRILAELDNTNNNLFGVVLKEYEKAGVLGKKEQEWVDKLYETYYPEGEERLQF